MNSKIIPSSKRGAGGILKTVKAYYIPLHCGAFFYFEKNGAVSYIRACHCRDPKFCYQIDKIFTQK